MNYTQLGNSDLNVSRICMGCMGFGDAANGQHSWTVDEEHSREIIKRGLELGVNFFDTAIGYQSGTSEQYVGRALRDFAKRDEVVVATKFLPRTPADIEAGITGQQHIERMINKSLENLGMDYVDMMLLHHPSSDDVAAYKAIEKAIQDGKVRSAGVSCYYIREINAFLPKVTIKPALVQNEIHPYYQDDNVVKHIQSLGIAIQGWYPLGGRGYTERLLNHKTLCGIAAAYGKSSAQVILRWNLQKGVSVIPGSSNEKHIRENISIFDFQLSSEDMEKIAALNKDEKHDWY